MKKALILALMLSLAFSSAVFGADVSIMLNGRILEPKDVNGSPAPPFISDGTTYLPVRALAEAMSVAVEWDNETRTVFLGEKGDAAPKLGEQVNIYVNGVKLNPTDANGNAVPPIIKDGSTYLPVRAVAQSFAKKVDWDGETSTVLINDSSLIDESKTYKILLHSTQSVIAPSGDAGGNALLTEVFDGDARQIWKFVPVDGGFYKIENLQTGFAVDVNGASKSPGARLLQYSSGTGENQKFMLVRQDNGAYKIYSKNSMLPIEASAGEIKQNDERDSGVQLWDIVEADPSPRQDKPTAYKTISFQGLALTYSTDSNELSALAADGGDLQQWLLVPTAEGNYAVNTKNGGRSMDVANNSVKSGDPIITYASGSGENQRWIFEKQENGGYKIKSVSSELYLTVTDDGKTVQTENGSVFTLADAR